MSAQLLSGLTVVEFVTLFHDMSTLAAKTDLMCFSISVVHMDVQESTPAGHRYS